MKMTKEERRLENERISKEYNARRTWKLEEDTYRIEMLIGCWQGKKMYAENHWYFDNKEDAIRFVENEVTCNTVARVVKTHYVKAENTLYTEVVFER